jgi:addiction module RelE/StbE family toxin
MKVNITAQAKAEMLRIGEWIERDNPFRAATFVDELYEACLELGSMAQAFPLLQRHEEAGIRRRVVGNYLIFYYVLRGRVEVIHILHGARDYEAILFPEPG